MRLILVFLISIGTFSVSSAQCDTKILEAFGGLSSIAVYNTYMTIGTISDAYVNKVYDANHVKESMSEQTAMLQSIIEMLSKCKEVKSNGLAEEDILYVQELMNCLASLKATAQGLNDFAATGSEEAKNNYTTNRDKAWEQITQLMGLE